jgi:hypothetical protein
MIVMTDHRPPASIIFNSLIGGQKRLEFGLHRLS